MHNFEMPASAFKADKYKTEKDIEELKNRVHALEEAVRIIAQSMPITVGGRK